METRFSNQLGTARLGVTGGIQLSHVKLSMSILLINIRIKVIFSPLHFINYCIEETRFYGNGNKDGPVD